VPHRPLLVTADPLLLEELLRLCELAGVEAEVAPDPSSARSSWVAAPLVVIGSDVASGSAARGLPRRDGVVLVGLDLDDGGVWQVAVELGADTVVFLPDAQSWLVGRLGEVADRGDRPRGTVVAVVGGRGGAGATTLAAALAVTAAGQGLGCMLLDADPLGGGIDLALGGEDTEGLRWPDLAVGGRVDGAALRAALPRVHHLTVLSWDRGNSLTVPPTALRGVLDAAVRTHDLVVVDLPRRVDEAAEVVLAAAHLTLLVVPAEVRATASAARVSAAVSLLARDLRVVVRGPSPAGVTGDVVADTLGLPLAGFVKPEPDLPRAMDCGRPPARDGRGPLAAFCRRLLAEVLDGRDAA
jgi:secretion/DNA translocation related CpaE-like protein